MVVYVVGMTQERPNTISGLQAKRAELVKLYDNLVADAKKVTCDIDHIDATIRLFDPEADIQRRVKNRYAIKHRAHFGHTKRFLLDMLRRAPEPMTSKQLTKAWIEERGMQPDEATRVILTKRIGACINGMRHKGLVESVGHSKSEDDARGPLKLWRIKTDR